MIACAAVTVQPDSTNNSVTLGANDTVNPNSLFRQASTTGPNTFISPSSQNGLVILNALPTAGTTYVINYKVCSGFHCETATLTVTMGLSPVTLTVATPGTGS